MKKRNVIHCGKVDALGSGRKINEAEIEIEWDGERLSICGTIWNAMHTKVVACGQCSKELAKHQNIRIKFKELLDIWKRWHLNDMRAGSPRQEAALEEFKNTHFSYDDACAYLKDIGLYKDTEFIYKGKPYEYGQAWLVEQIPAEVVKRIEYWIDYKN